jgi:hypothetical protein
VMGDTDFLQQSMQFIKRNSRRRLRPQVSALPASTIIMRWAPDAQPFDGFLSLPFSLQILRPHKTLRSFKTLWRVRAAIKLLEFVASLSDPSMPAWTIWVRGPRFSMASCFLHNRKSAKQDAEKSPMVQIKRHAHALPLWHARTRSTSGVKMVLPAPRSLLLVAIQAQDLSGSWRSHTLSTLPLWCTIILGVNAVY